MHFRTPRPLRWTRARLVVAAAAMVLVFPAVARAQYSAPELDSSAIGERYHIEAAGTLWDPNLAGQISSEQFGILGSNIDFVNDLSYKQTRFKDFRLVLRPSRRSKFQIEYTPIEYSANSHLSRTVVFNGQNYQPNVPIYSDFAWKVWRLGYEYDVTSHPRWYAGLVLEARYTQMNATLLSPDQSLDEYTIEKAPLPALGGIGRVYVTRQVALNFEVTGFKLPNVTPKYQANYYDWDIHGTVNFTNNVGLEVGWRRISTYLAVKSDTGNLLFQGMWFGAAVRY